MSRRFAIAFVIFVLASSVAPLPRVFCQDARVDDAIKCVLTRQDAVYEGRVVDKGDSYSVEFPNGGALSISKLDVLFIGDSREAAYRFKISGTRMEDANEALKAADWAGRHGMGKEAIQTLTTLAGSTNDEAEKRAFAKKIEDLQTAERFREAAERARLAKRQEATTSEPPNRSAQARAALSEEDAELDAWGRALPPAALEKFSRKAFPVLQKRCATSGCHAQGTPGARFALRDKALGASQRLALLYNLRETCLYVDFNQLDASPLVNHPVVLDSNGARRYPFGEDRYSARDCENFLSWFNGLDKEKKLGDLMNQYRRARSDAPQLRANAASRYDVENAASRDESATQTNDVADESFAELFDSPSVETIDSEERGASVFRQGISPDAQRFAQDPYEDVNSPESALRRVGMAPQKKYRDEYDPAIFNDRYHPNGK